MSKEILTAKELTLTHRNVNVSGQPSFLLKGINFSLTKNSSISIIGESGTGKTTLMNALVGLHPIAKGMVLFYGNNVKKFDKHEKLIFNRSIQPVFQNYHHSFNPMVPVRKSLLIGFDRHKAAVEKTKDILEYLYLVELPHEIIDKFPHQLSGGELQRLAFVRALTTAPRILILDEPFSSLDVINEKKLLDVIQKIQRKYKLSIIFITHKLPLVRYFNDQVYKIIDHQFTRCHQYE